MWIGEMSKGISGGPSGAGHWHRSWSGLAALEARLFDRDRNSASRFDKFTRVPARRNIEIVLHVRMQRGYPQPTGSSNGKGGHGSNRPQILFAGDLRRRFAKDLSWLARLL